MVRKPFCDALSILMFLVVLTVSVFSQGTTSRLTGTVTDNTGAAVAGATVTLTNEGTLITLNTVTSEEGLYNFDLIPAGTYTVTVEKSGFKKLVSTGNMVNVNLPATVNAALEIGDVSAVVNVENTAEVVQTSTSGNVGTVIEERAIESLPIVGTRGRNPLDLLNYQPGVVNGANTGGGIHVHGSRDRSFNFTLDGIDINESTAGGSNFTPLRPNPESIQEFQITTSNFTAELGRSSGAQVSFVTRSGTNRFSGNLFEYYQTPGANANEYGNNLLRVQRPQFVQHIFGGSLGGPLFNPGFGEGTTPFDLLKDRAFFFVNMQFLRASESRLVQRTVYTQAARAGNFRYVRGGRNAAAGTQVSTAFPTGGAVDNSGNPLFPNCSATITTQCIATYNVANNPSGIGVDQNILAAINSTPLPNDFTRGDGLNTAGFNFLAPQNEKQYDFVSKFDFKINDNNNFYVRYAQGEQNTFGDSGNAGLQSFPGFPNLVDTFRKPKNLAINYRSSPTAKLTNEFIFGYSSFGFSFDTPSPDPNVPFILNLTSDTATNFSYNARSARTFQFVDNVTFDLSPHLIKMGVNFRFGKQFDDRSTVSGTNVEPVINFSRTINSNFNAFGLASAPTGLNANDFNTLRSQINDYLGRVGSYTQAFVALPDGSAFAPAGTRYNFTAYYPEYDFYVQDTWRFRPNLTFDIGVRYEPKLSPSSSGLPILRPDQPVNLAAAPSNTLKYVEGDLFKNDLNNFSPSIGFAWDPFKNGKTSVRANYRLAYDRISSFVFASSIFQSTPGNNFAFPVDTNFGSGGGLYRNIQPIVPTRTPNEIRQPSAYGTGSITVIDQDLVFPEIHQWFAGVQREIGFNSVLEVNYIGKRGTHLFGGYDANQVNVNAKDPRFSETFLQAFNTVRAGGDSALINQLFLNDSRRTAAQTGSQFVRAQFGTNITTGSVASVAAAAAQRQQGNSSLLALGGFSPFFFQRYPQFAGSLNVLDSSDVSRYNALEIILKRRINKGVGFQLSYTLAKSEDTRSFDPIFTTVGRGTGQSASSTPFDNNNRRLNYAPSDFDRRHALQGTYVIELPFGRDRYFGSNAPKIVDFLLGGWQLAGTLNLTSGRPFTVYSESNTLSNAVVTPANCNGCSRDMGSVFQQQLSNGTSTNYYFTPEQIALFSNPNPGEFSNVGRNYFIGPKQFQTDASLSKKFSFTETLSFDLRVDAKNLTNTPAFGFPGALFNTSTFGEIRGSTVSSARRLQFSGKLNF
jgi:hypothetical protein